ncbi:MAG: BREX-1 system phosphatase PglZ type B, partial [Armatimonadetes bacterium]|nr:BREX-1 system phosphatase PglZ type B [Armatimonadota bacterium]
MSVAQALTRCLRLAGAFTAGDQVSPCAILWTDAERLWEGVIEGLKPQLPELFVFGSYVPGARTGPAIYLRCIEARALEPALPEGLLPIFYLPGVSKQQLRAVEDCPPALQPLVELQFRGTVWNHPNGRDWTPTAFLGSAHGGLGLEVARDAATADALLRALALLMKEKVGELRSQRLDADFFDRLLAPDLPSLLLRWMSDPQGVKGGKTEAEWTAFCHQCAEDYEFHPQIDGELRAAQLLGNRKNHWATVWQRFAEAPQRYPGVVALLEQAEPSELVFDREPWPRRNEVAEQALAAALKDMDQQTPDVARACVLKLEKTHGPRRGWVWAEIGRSQFARALGHLSRLAELTVQPLAAGSAVDLAKRYTKEGWEVDAQALAALACCTGVAHEEPIGTAVRTLYLPWLDATALHLQQLQKAAPESLHPHLNPVEAVAGRVILFADGLRFDLAQRLAKRLSTEGLKVEVEWDWAPFPGVTATAKPYVSPVAGRLQGSVS